MLALLARRLARSKNCYQQRGGLSITDDSPPTANNLPRRFYNPMLKVEWLRPLLVYRYRIAILYILFEGEGACTLGKGGPFGDEIAAYTRLLIFHPEITRYGDL